jgi:hypothetical protein
MSAQEKPVGSRASKVLLYCALVMVPWIIYLAVTLGSDYMVRRWGVAWVGLDVAEVAGLLGSAALIRRHDPLASPVAAATGTLFLVDAWFDTVTAHIGMDYLQSLTFAWCAEIPLAVFCAIIAWRSTRWSAQSARSR